MIVIDQFTFTNTNKWDAVLVHIFIVAFIPDYCLRHVMPVVAVKLDDQIQRGNISINEITTNTVLFFEVKLHNLKKLIADDFQQGRIRTFFEAFPGAISCALVVIGGLDSFAFTAVFTGYRYALSHPVFAQALRAAKVCLFQGGLYAVNLLSAISAVYDFSVLFIIGSCLACMLGGAFPRAKVTLARLNQIYLLPKFPLAVVALNKFSCPPGVVCALSVSVVTCFAAIQMGMVCVVV